MVWNYLDFKDILVNQISGSSLIFVLISVIGIAYVCAKFKVPNIMTIMILGLWMLILGAFNPFQWCLVVGGLLFAVFIGWQLIKIFQR